MKKKHIALYILGALIIIVAAIAIWQRDTLSTLYKALTISSEELSAKDKLNNDEMKAALAEQGVVAPDISENEVEAVIRGDKTTREAAEELLKKQLAERNEADNTDSGNPADTLEQKLEPTAEPQQTTNTAAPATAEPESTATSSPEKTTAPTTPASSAPTESPKPTSVPSEAPAATSEPQPEDYYDESKVSDDVNYEINLRVTELYVVESLYYAKIDEVIKEAKDEYRQLPKEKRTKSSKINIALSKAGKMTSLQTECDAQVYAIIDEIEQILIDAGQSTSLSDNLRQYYNNKKADQQAYYLSKLSS
jgi:hypothetical protein